MTCVASIASSLVPFGCEATQHSLNYQFVVVVVAVVTKAAFSGLIAPVPFVGHTGQVAGLSITTRRPLTALQLSGRPLIAFQDYIFIVCRVGLVLGVCRWACYSYLV